MMTERYYNGSEEEEEVDNRDVVCPYTGKEHTMEGPKATMCPSRDWVARYLGHTE